MDNHILISDDATIEAAAPPGVWRRLDMALAEPAKRGFDLLAAGLGLIAVSPLLVLIACFVALDGGPIVFGHQRVGRDGKMFPCYKFRTMMPGAELCLAEYLELHPQAAAEWRDGHKLSDDPRITGIGRFLRRTSLDELPQLWNVVRGEMSLVGPRPVTEAEIAAHYGELAGLYMAVRPGITGLWQIMGRNALSYQARVELDAHYVVVRSFLTDLVILARTVAVVLRRDGV